MHACGAAGDCELKPRPDPRLLAAIFCGGATGALARAGLGELLAPAPAGWPWATFTVNVAGAFLLGYFVTRLQERLAYSTYRRPLLATGFCGALTTFSTMQVELLEMLDAARWSLAAGYGATSIAAGFAAVFLATRLVRRVALRNVSGALLWLAAGALGGLGAIARFLLDGAVAARTGGRTGLGTAVVNVTGAFALGLLTGLAVDDDAGLLIGTALLGSYTTFSTWMFETHRLAEDGFAGWAALNVAGSLATGIAAAALGRWIGAG